MVQAQLREQRQDLHETRETEVKSQMTGAHGAPMMKVPNQVREQVQDVHETRETEVRDAQGQKHFPPLLCAVRKPRGPVPVSFHGVKGKPQVRVLRRLWTH